MANQETKQKVYVLTIKTKEEFEEKEELDVFTLGTNFELASTTFRDCCDAIMKDIKNAKDDFCVKTRDTCANGVVFREFYVKVIGADCHAKVELMEKVLGEDTPSKPVKEEEKSSSSELEKENKKLKEELINKDKSRHDLHHKIIRLEYIIGNLSEWASMHNKEFVDAFIKASRMNDEELEYYELKEEE